MRTRSSTAQRLRKLVTSISLVSLCATSSAFAANSEFLATFEKEILTPASQATYAWTNSAPNALASYYTYVPYSNADAVSLGFPAICGNPNTATIPVVPATVPATFTVAPLDAASTADCYTISVRQLVQPMSLDFLKYVGIPGFPGKGLIGKDGLTPLVDTAHPSDPAALLASAGAGKLTTAWGYGSGGAGWMPNYPATTTVTGNAPAAFQNVPFNGLFGAGNNGDPNAKGVWHFPAPTIKGTKGRQVLVQWKNELVNTKPVGHDPSVDCGDVAQNCYPFNRQVVHVHGAHVGPESDGLAVSWYTPNFALQGEGAFPKAGVPGAMTGAHAYYDAQGNPIYQYPLDQPASTIWYHDHAVGTTHMNTDMGMAGFFPVTDNFEKCLQGNTAACTAAAVTPPVTPILPSGDAFELGFALQDRHFDVNGQMVMPANATYDKNDTNCVFDANNNALPGTCARLNWMKRKNLPSATDPTPAVHLVPYVAGAPELSATFNPAAIPVVGGGTNAANFPYYATIDQAASYAANFPTSCKVNTTNTFEGISGVDTNGSRIPFTQCAPFPATSATLEYFGNMPVVNGVTYGVYDVEPTVYRMRFIGGTDSRTWITQLTKEGAIPSKMNCGSPQGCDVYNASDIIPFYQVGSEQGLLPAMVKRNEIDMMPGERFDVLVDFSGVAGTTVTLKNLGDDAPYSGRFDFDGPGLTPGADISTRQPTSVDIPEIMKFRVNAVAATPVTSGVAAPFDGAPLAGIVIPTLTPLKTRVLSLQEITDQYGRTMPTIDARGYIPPGIRTTEVINQGTVEQWDIVNTTVDAHPMHIHQVAFQTIDRQAVDVGAAGAANGPGFKAGANFTFGADTRLDFTPAARAASVFSDSQYVVVPGSTPIPAPAYEAGWKDSTPAYPGYVVRVKALYDLVGDYVWHCHILSHEEHDMMRPFRVTSAGAVNAPVTLAVGAINGGIASVTVTPGAAQPVGTQYVVQYRKTVPVTVPPTTPNFWETNNSAAVTQSINLIASGVGTYEFRAQAIEPALQNHNFNTMSDSAWVTSTPATRSFTGVSITSAGSLPAYTIGNGIYSTGLAATGGVPNYHWSIVPGFGTGLPAGFSLNATTGVLSSVAAPSVTAALYSFRIQVADSHAPVASVAVLDATLDVLAPVALALPTVTLPAYTIGSGAFTAPSFVATGGIPPYFYSTLGLTGGLTINSSTGALTGMPTVAGPYSFTVSVTDSATPPAAPVTVAASYTVSAALPLNITTTSPLTLGTVGTAYNYTLAATGGNVGIGYTYAVTIGTLPAGLLMSPAGVITGIPTVAGTALFGITVTDRTVPTAVTTTPALFSLSIQPGALPPALANVALASNGAVATASSDYSAAFPVSAVNNGDRAGLNWVNGGGWNDATVGVFGDWVEIAFNGAKTITEVDVFTIQDSPGAPVTPTVGQTFTLYGATAFNVEYWDTATSTWIPVPGGVVVGNNLVWKQLIFAAITTTKIRVVVNASADAQYSRIAEIEAW